MEELDSKLVIILDGADGVGKSTVRKYLHEHDPTAFIIERFTPSMFAYGVFYRRKIDVVRMLKYEERLSRNFNVHAVLIECSDEEELWDRFRRSRHIVNLSKQDLQMIQQFLRSYCKYVSTLNWETYDSFKKSAEDIAKQIISEVYKNGN